MKKVWALSLDLRERAVAAWERGEGTQRVVAERFGISQPVLSDWIRLKRERGELVPRRPTGRPRAFTEEFERVLTDLLMERSDRTLDELVDGVAERTGRVFGRQSVMRAIQRLGWSRKKNSVRRRAQ
jgi:transposase